MEQYLPIGSVVLLKNGTKKVMIYGRRQVQASTGIIFDYVACFYPEGNISDEYTFLFNHENIDKVIFTGYNDNDEVEYSKVLLSLEGNLENEK